MSAIQPLRIQKGTPVSSPTKMNGAPISRPLAEISPMERRRNSPSYNQTTKKPLFNIDSSPYDTPPYGSGSPRQYWQSRDPASPTRFNMENRNPNDGSSPIPSKRSSIENLKKASRVKNSNMFAREQKREYDPTSTPVIERPLATGRPLSVQGHINALIANSTDGKRQDTPNENTRFPAFSPLRSLNQASSIPEPQKSPTRDPTSPSKSSLSKNSRYAQQFDPENGTWSEEEESIVDRQLPPGRSLHRHAKSVTFDAAPPQINEYEMTTPDPSSVASGSREGSYDTDGDDDESFDRASVERDDSFDASLEDTDKTPVVLPEDWRFMSPAIAHDDLARNMEDPFEGEKSSPPPTANPNTLEVRASPTRTDSVNSNGERRPLPPLPGFMRPRSDSSNSLLATAERITSSQRYLPSTPRPASISKSDLQGMGASSMSIEERLRLMMLQEAESPRNAAEEQRERRMRRAGTKSPEPAGIKIHEDAAEEENNKVADIGEYQLPPKISRESILRRVKSQPKIRQDEEYDYSSPAATPSPERSSALSLDPDVPIPSLEDPSAIEAEESVVIKQEEDAESEVDVYAIPEMYHQNLDFEFSNSTAAGLTDVAIPSSGSAQEQDDDDESHYSTDLSAEHASFVTSPSHNSAEEEGGPTPRPESPQLSNQVEKISRQSQRLSLGQFASMLGEDDFGLSFQSYMTPSPPVAEEPTKTESKSASTETLQQLERPLTPVQHPFPLSCSEYSTDVERPTTPDSVIHYTFDDPPAPDSPSIPEPSATIKAPGATLKTRPSLAPADAREMAQTRRQVSGEMPEVPSIPERYQHRPSTVQEEYDDASPVSEKSAGLEGDIAKSVKRKSSLVQLEVPVEVLDEGLSIGLDKEFDRVIEAQKVAFEPFLTDSKDSSNPLPENPLYRNFANISSRKQKGYLMRQNTKMVVASSASIESSSDTVPQLDPTARGTRSAGNSPRKPSQTQTWTTEPWNGKVRRKSIRQSAGSPQKRPTNGPTPPMPGQQSNVTQNGLDSVNENGGAQDTDPLEVGEERGRLFVKVVGVKELDLPLPRGERSYFALTLDNGLHCVTTAWLELGKNAPIGQEFELTVLDELEFQLTLQTKIEEPKVTTATVPPPSPTKAPKSPSKPSTFSRVFASPRKRKELEMQQKEEAQRAERERQANAAAAAAANRRPKEPSSWDLLHNLVAKDGSFARAYICLKDHESRAYGRPFTVDIPCFNEWAMEEVRSIGNRMVLGAPRGAAMQRKAPYKIGKLELQLLYVPKPKGAGDEDMPKSMNACIREMQEAEQQAERSWEGFLSQQGGDCPYWRRRFFRLSSHKLTAYHESTRQPRATINLAKASKLIDDKSSLTQKEVSGKGGARRKSAFAAEEEGYMFVEEGFRVRFANGETIDFYADSADEKEGWMRALSEVVGKEVRSGKKWTDLVLARQKAMAAQRAEQGARRQSRGPPVGASMGEHGARRQSRGPPVGPSMAGARPANQINKRPGSAGNGPTQAQSDARHRNAEERRAKARSMLF